MGPQPTKPQPATGLANAKRMPVTDCDLISLVEDSIETAAVRSSADSWAAWDTLTQSQNVAPAPTPPPAAPPAWDTKKAAVLARFHEPLGNAPLHLQTHGLSHRMGMLPFNAPA